MKKKRNIKKRLLIALSVLIVTAGLIAAGNVMALQNLVTKGSCYNAVDVQNQLVPQKDENGT